MDQQELIKFQEKIQKDVDAEFGMRLGGPAYQVTLTFNQVAQPACSEIVFRVQEMGTDHADQPSEHVVKSIQESICEQVKECKQVKDKVKVTRDPIMSPVVFIVR
jgi:hypothetical protein